MPRPRANAAAWYRVGTEDDDEIALTRHLGHTLGAALGEPGVIEAAAPGRIADLVRALDDPAIGSVQLIIDDLHEITGTPAERALESFLPLRPRKIRVSWAADARLVSTPPECSSPAS